MKQNKIRFIGLHLSGAKSAHTALSIVDYYINNNWSVNVAYSLNISRTKEKDGIRGEGYRIGAAILDIN